RRLVSPDAGGAETLPVLRPDRPARRRFLRYVRAGFRLRSVHADLRMAASEVVCGCRRQGSQVMVSTKRNSIFFIIKTCFVLDLRHVAARLCFALATQRRGDSKRKCLRWSSIPASPFVCTP